MYNLIECASNYSEATGSLCFYSKDEATNFNADVANKNFKSFEYKAIVGYGANTVADGTNGVPKSGTIGRSIVFCLQLVLIMIMLILIILSENYMFL